MSLRLRVALLAAAVVTVTVAALGTYAVRTARSELTEEVDNDLLKRATLAFPGVTSDISTSGAVGVGGWPDAGFWLDDPTVNSAAEAWPDSLMGPDDIWSEEFATAADSTAGAWRESDDEVMDSAEEAWPESPVDDTMEFESSAADSDTEEWPEWAEGAADFEGSSIALESEEWPDSDDWAMGSVDDVSPDSDDWAMGSADDVSPDSDHSAMGSETEEWPEWAENAARDLVAELLPEFGGSFVDSAAGAWPQSDETFGYMDSEEPSPEAATGLQFEEEPQLALVDEAEDGHMVRADLLGALVSFDVYARVVVSDFDSGGDGAIRGGEVVFTFDDDFGTAPRVDRLERARQSGTLLETVHVNGRSLRLMTVPLTQDGVFVQVARPLREVENAVADLRRWVLLFSTLAVVVAAASAWFLAGRAVRPIVRLTDTAEQIARTGQLDREVPGTGTGEVGRLAHSFRTMLEALATSRRQQRRLVMDASHELRTPLTSLRTNIDLLRRGEQLPVEERAEVLDDVDAELGELTDLVAELVDLAADVRIDGEPELVELPELLGAVVERARRRSGREITLRVEREVPLEGRPEALARAVRNLVDNALKFSGHGPVEVVVNGGEVNVHDAGPGVAEADRERIFERFHRLESSRDQPGSGLGLAIVRQVAEAHGGEVQVGESPLGGAAFTLRIPEIDD